MYVPDNEDIRKYMVDEEERIDRLHKRFLREELEDKEDERIISSYKSEARNDRVQL